MNAFILNFLNLFPHYNFEIENINPFGECLTLNGQQAEKFIINYYLYLLNSYKQFEKQYPINVWKDPILASNPQYQIKGFEKTSTDKLSFYGASLDLINKPNRIARLEQQLSLLSGSPMQNYNLRIIKKPFSYPWIHFVTLLYLLFLFIFIIRLQILINYS